MPPKSTPLHQIIERSVQADDINELIKPGTIVWAKLRGYPWWPGRVKGPGGCPKELAHIAKTQYRPGTVVTVYFFGSHDFSLVPVESLRPFEPNWELFCNRSSSSRFTQALIEARDPDRYRHLENASGAMPKGSVHDSKLSEITTDKRKRGRPPKNPKPRPRTVAKSAAVARKREISGQRPKRFSQDGLPTQEHIYYCRVKLQKILLRNQLKDGEMAVGRKIMDALQSYQMSLEVIRGTKIGLVLRKASRRLEFREEGNFCAIGDQIGTLLASWKRLLERFIWEVGL